eukprot:TRINITY_DN1926_c0_g1_i1.p1 TRINITY_DN1926_c0_g1~~TRINITY_DN1926_c0_g1_i1.p1  ORF type:complete len:234 (-),score=38.19 TRINITY_DN1926_c0_g1_i1:220-921(-)
MRVCADIVLGASLFALAKANFDCANYITLCSSIAGYEAYKDCAATIAVNNATDMACRITHLGKAATDAATHCPHAAPTAAAPCNTEMLKTFDCAAYVSRCSSITGYQAYPDCAATVAANGANGMACRIQHLGKAATDAATHCPHAAPNATGPCQMEALASPTPSPTPSASPTPAPSATPSPTPSASPTPAPSATPSPTPATNSTMTSTDESRTQFGLGVLTAFVAVVKSLVNV